MKSHTSRPNILLAQARMDFGLSQPELAKRLGVSVKQVWRWENGRAQPRHHYRRLLCTLFHKTAEELGLDSVKRKHSGPPPTDISTPETPLEAQFRAFVKNCQAHPVYQDEYQAFLKRSQQFNQQPHGSVSFVDWLLAAHPEHIVKKEPLPENGHNQPA
jgi:transcriptional regulator with XRE-family HTH domain